jgi:hypothetical protein
MLWGDLDCDDDVDEQDAMTSLHHASGVTIAQEPGCSPIGSALGVLTFGDVNCDGRTGALDALGLLLYRAGAPNPASGCPPIGSPV